MTEKDKVSRLSLIKTVITPIILVLIVCLGSHWVSDWAELRARAYVGGFFGIIFHLIITLVSGALALPAMVYLGIYHALFDIDRLPLEQRDLSQYTNHMLFWSTVLVSMWVIYGLPWIKRGGRLVLERTAFIHHYLTDRKLYSEKKMHPEDIERTQLVAELKAELAERERHLAMLKKRHEKPYS